MLPFFAIITSGNTGQTMVIVTRDNVWSKEHEKSHDKAKSGEVDVETEINPLLQELFK